MEEERQKKSFEIDMVRGPVLKKMLMFSLSDVLQYSTAAVQCSRYRGSWTFCRR